MAVEAVQVFANELAQLVDVFHLLHREDIEIHPLDPVGDQLALGRRLLLDQPPLVFPQLEASRVRKREGRLRLDRRGCGGRDVGLEVEPRNEVVQIEGPDANHHQQRPTRSDRELKSRRHKKEGSAARRATPVPLCARCDIRPLKQTPQ
jgi:hypothetical protein